MKAMASARALLLGLGAVIVFGGSTCKHLPDPWVPTANPGDCVPLPDHPGRGNQLDNCSEANTAEEAEDNGSLFYAAQVDERACGGGVVIPGRLAAPDDVDLFSVARCKLPFLSPLDPTSRATKVPSVTVRNADNGTEVCLFAYCELGVTSLGTNGCPVAGTVPAHLEEGMLGCCRRDSGQLVTSIVCDSYSVEATSLIAVRSVSSICHSTEPYELTFSIAPPPGS